MKEGGATLPLMTEGSVDWCCPGNQVNMHFTDLPQARVPQKKRKLYMKKSSVLFFYFALWYFVYFIKLIVLEHFYFFKKM